MLLFKCCLSGRLRELKNKGKDQLVFHKSGRSRLRERSLSGLSVTEFNWQFKRGITMVVVTRAGRLREWSQGELWLYKSWERTQTILYWCSPMSTLLFSCLGTTPLKTTAWVSLCRAVNQMSKVKRGYRLDHYSSVAATNFSQTARFWKNQWGWLWLWGFLTLS